jgi:acyl-coenzyme A synthetase/AMP-(fatty) acid ligase/acyl carrier protein
VMCLLSGASMHILSDALKANYAKLEQYFAEHRITATTFPPTYLGYVDPERVPSLRMVAVAGSECAAKLLRKWNERVAFYNAYGPTEHSVCIAVFNAPRHRYEDDTVPIGRPLFNKRIYIVGPDRQLQPIGAPGELWVSGIGTSRGYLGQPELTRERFVPNPFPVLLTGPRAAAHAVAYRTGDLARWRDDGCIEFIGRVDNQVKVRGYRIELDEIDSAMMRVPGVRQAAAVVKKSAEDANVLYGYYTAPAGVEPSEVRSALASSIPDFMIPSQLIRIDEMPLTNSDKIDRKALAALPDATAATAAEPIHAANGDVVAQKICAIIASVLGRQLPPDAIDGPALQMLGVDSLQFMKVVVQLESEFGLEFDEDFLLSGRSMSVAAIAQMIEDSLQRDGASNA